MKKARVAKAPIHECEKDHDLMWKCAWCYPSTSAPPLPIGKKGYTDGICPAHLAMLKEEAKLSVHSNSK